MTPARNGRDGGAYLDPVGPDSPPQPGDPGRPAGPAPLLEVQDLTVEFPGPRGRPPLRALSDVSLSVHPGATLGLVGESGSGKTTLCLAILGLVPIASGAIYFDDQDIGALSRRQRRVLSRHLQVVFQDPYSSLNPARTIGQTLSEPLEVHEKLARSERQRQITAMLDRVGLSASAADRYPAEFSGGQRQRIAIARALMVSPKLVICDEPVSALDLSVQAQILNLLADLQRDLSVAYLFVSHDLAVVRHLSTEVTVLYRGQVMETGPARRVCGDPSHPYTQALLAARTGPGGGWIPPPAAPAVQTRPAPPGAADPAPGCPYQDRCAIAADRCRQESPPLRTAATGALAACHLLPTAQPSPHLAGPPAPPLADRP
jgi:oligopeptide/dipeptide ABC transporter ATP-binding protein